MSSGYAFAQPILLEVSADGRLIQADAQIMRLQLLAGGAVGGALAIPDLAAIAAATQKLQMRLARAVIIADDDQDIDAWVESEPAGKAVNLKITGWRPRIVTGAGQDRASELDASGTATQWTFDADMRLIDVSAGDSGIGSAEIGAEIGSMASELFPSGNASNVALLDAMESRAEIRADGVTLSGSRQQFTVLEIPRFDKTGNLSSYLCELLAVPMPSNLADQTGPSGTLFGAQLGAALRQPLGRIIANAETIGSKLQGPIRDSYAVYAKDIADAARHLVALVDDLGDLEAIEKPNFTTANDHIELGDIARRVAGLLALKAADHQITINVPDGSKQIFATAEFRRVLQILINLVTNAVRYSPDGTQITIKTGTAGDLAVITVEDQGAGIAPADREKIFEKFERLGRSGDGGSGLGLYISRKLARFMDGDLTVSGAEQGGTIFSLALPR